MNMSLYEISHEVAELDELLGSCDDPNAPEIQQAIDRLLELTSDRESKIDNYCNYIKSLEALRDARKAESKRLAESAAMTGNKIDRLKKSLQTALQTMDIKKVETERYTVSRAKNGGKLALEVDESLVPDDFKLTVETVKVDKDAIREALDGGMVLPFAQYKERGESLRIK